ncbi:MAG: RNA polymerase sigma factor [Candidatus Acidiferrales bacterium]
MPSNVVKIDESEATLVSFSDLGAEEALVTAAKRGDGRAFEILVKRHEPGILALALRYTRVREDAEDVVQKSFQKAFVHLHRFEGKSRFSTWLSRIAINEALMLLRKKRASPEVPIEESTTMEETSLTLDHLPDSDPSPEENCLHEERKRILSAAINQLTPRKRKAIELRELGEFSTTETARILGLSISAVKARVFHARKALRTSLKDTSGLFGRPGETLKSQREDEACLRRNSFPARRARKGDERRLS